MTRDELINILLEQGTQEAVTCSQCRIFRQCTEASSVVTVCVLLADLFEACGVEIVTNV